MEVEREEFVAEESGVLEARPRRRQQGNSSHRVEETGGDAAEGGGGEAERRGVYFVGDNDQAAVEDDIDIMKLKMDDQIACCDEHPNGKSVLKPNKISEQKDIPAEELNHSLKNSKVENGSNPQIYSKTRINGITKSEDEITEDKGIPVLKWSKSKDVDFDLERILEEQDTHDLYCPNCNSCITKRVILRKRKRSVKQTKNDAPSKRVHDEHHDAGKLDNRAVSGEMTNPSDAQEPDVFRCLSCFSFFIPTEGGFNLFYLFEKGKGNHVQSPEKLPDKKVNWISSMFKVDKSKSKGSEPGASLTTEIIQTRKTSMFSGDAELCQNSSLPENDHSDAPVIGPSDVSSKEQLMNQMKEHGPDTEIMPSPGATIQIKYLTNTSGKVNDANMSAADADAIPITSQSDQIIQSSEVTTTVVLSHPDQRIDIADRIGRDTEINNGWDVLKSIVYGGLIESITSLCVVSSAAGSGASTLSIFAMGLANFFGGLLLIIHELFELGSAQNKASEQKDEQVGRYWELLGQRVNFRLHFVVALTSYILAGLLPPVIYGFSFMKSDDKEYKLIAVTSASLLCIALLAIGKAHIKPQKAYIKTLFYYLSLGVSSSAISYIAGETIKRLVEKFGLFDHSTNPPSALTILSGDISSEVPAWASY